MRRAAGVVDAAVPLVVAVVARGGAAAPHGAAVEPPGAVRRPHGAAAGIHDDVPVNASRGADEKATLFVVLMDGCD